MRRSRHTARLVIMGLGIAVGLPGQPASSLPPAAQGLLDRARAATPQRYQYALDRGASILPTSEGRSFYLLWRPPGASERNHPLVVTLHGSSGWAFDEFYLWHEQAANYGYGILALQWWFGTGENSDAYYAPADLHRELRSALHRQENQPGAALLHGFSRGAANIYAVAALDRQSADRFYAMILANAGGASRDFPPNLAISNGDYGYNVFSGTYWTMFCGGMDPNPERDGCPAMRRTAEWVELFGGATSLFIEDPAAGHGGFHQTPAHIRAALDAYRENLSLRRGALKPDTRWQVRRDPQFEIPGASIPNVGLVNGEVWLAVGTNRGPRLYRSSEGANSQTAVSIPGLNEALSGSGFTVGEVIPREGPDGQPQLYVLGLAGPGVNRSAVFRLRMAGDGRFVRDPSGPVFEGGPADGQFIGVPDVTSTHDRRLRLTYVSRGGNQHNSRTAISGDAGASFSAEFRNPFGDLAVPNPKASDTNVDPAVLRLERGGYLAVTMRATRLFLFTSIDGRTFVPSPTAPIEAPQLAPGSTGLFDPTLVQLPDGRIFMCVTAASDPGGADGRVVRAELAPLAEEAPAAPVIFENGVRNAASYGPQIAPGAMISIFGANLAAATAQAPGYPLPRELGGARVTLNGISAPLFYASSNQINAQAPFEVGPGTASLTVGTATLRVNVAQTAPGIFKLQAELATPWLCAPGDLITIYLTGQGEVSPAVPTGSAAPASPLSRPVQAVKATIGGKEAEILFAGLAPGFAGLMQMNLRVPDVPPGQQPVTVTVGTAVSNAARVWIIDSHAGGEARPALAHRSSRQFAIGTHRPEILTTSQGEIVLVVVEPEGAAFSTGQVKHKAYRFTSDWRAIGEPFVVTRTTQEFGEPADHRAAVVNDQLVVVYQTLVWRETPPIGGGPAEPYASEQSLMLARFTLDGREILRKPILAHVADNREENFPDHCLLWRGDHLLVSTGSLGGKLKIRKVDLDGNVLAASVFQNTEENVPDNIGNSLLWDGRRVWMISATGPHRSASLTITEILPDLTPARPLVFLQPDREQHFPVGNLLTGDWVFVGYHSRPRGGPNPPEQNPYSPFLKIFSRNFEVLADFQIGEAGFLGVHPTLARLGSRLFVAWSGSVQIGARIAPQVRVEEYEIGSR